MREEKAVFINCTPHLINLNDGSSIEVSGNIPRVSVSFSDFDSRGISTPIYGDVTGLPQEEAGTYLIVSAMVLNASSRLDLVAPATGHPGTIRNDRGHIVSVPGFVR